MNALFSKTGLRNFCLIVLRSKYRNRRLDLHKLLQLHAQNGKNQIKSKMVLCRSICRSICKWICNPHPHPHPQLQTQQKKYLVRFLTKPHRRLLGRSIMKNLQSKMTQSEEAGCQMTGIQTQRSWRMQISMALPRKKQQPRLSVSETTGTPSREQKAARSNGMPLGKTGF